MSAACPYCGAVIDDAADLRSKESRGPWAPVALDCEDPRVGPCITRTVVVRCVGCKHCGDRSS